jgi:hypothetical protein
MRNAARAGRAYLFLRLGIIWKMCGDQNNHAVQA